MVRGDENPARSDGLSVAVVGAGISALSAARRLAEHALAVSVFDKARGPGGRLATRRADDYAFDHGAQYFTVTDTRFRRYVDAWVDQGVVRRWDGRIGVAEGGSVSPKDSETLRYVGTPRMSSIARHLSRDLGVELETRVGAVTRDGDRWRLSADGGRDLGAYDAVLIATPPAQAAPLLVGAPHLAQRVRTVRMLPCWAVMAVFEEELPVAFDGIFVQGSPLSWVARNSSKPGRPPHESWVLHGSPEWTAKNLEREEDAIADELLTIFLAVVGVARREPGFLQAHRWRYAMPEKPLEEGCLWDDDLKIGVCGDWCQGSRVEGAFLSGAASAGRILGLADLGSVAPEANQGSLF